MDRVREAFACAGKHHPGAARRDDGLMAAFLPGPVEPSTAPPQWAVSDGVREGDAAVRIGMEHGAVRVGGSAPPSIGAPETVAGDWADAQWDRGSVSVLTALGFAEHHVRSALTAHSGSLDLAMAYLCAEDMESEEGAEVAVCAPHVDVVGDRAGDRDAAGKHGARRKGDGLFSCAKSTKEKGAEGKLEEPESATAARAVVMRGCASRAAPTQGGPERRPVFPVALTPPPGVGHEEVPDDTSRGDELLGGFDRVPRMTDPRYGWADGHPEYSREPASPPHLTN
eukprot:COSAG02_NODE_4104_length_5771_cov_9.131005_3_plen_283_part_00